MKDKFIQLHAHEHRVSCLCRVLQVSRSGFSTWQGRPDSARAQRHRLLIERMRVLHQQTRQAYGARRMWWLLKRVGNRVAAIGWPGCDAWPASWRCADSGISGPSSTASRKPLRGRIA